MNNTAHFIWLGSELPFCYKLNIQTFKRQFKTIVHTEPLPNMVNIELFNKHDLTLSQCLKMAYLKIKDRTGKTENGVFIKNSDI